MIRRILASMILASLCSLAAGCAQVSVWERDVLARPDMAWDSDALEAQRRHHVFFSKEASLPGGGAGGGGCGCN